MKYFIFLSFLSLVAFGWGAPDLLPSKEREYETSFETKLNKKNSYKKILVWTAKSFANSNEAIKLKDEELGVVIAKGNLSCDSLKLGNGFGENQIIEFTIEITSEDKKISIKISDVIGKAIGSFDSESRPSKKEEMDKVSSECLSPFVAKIKEAITSSK